MPTQGAGGGGGGVGGWTGKNVDLLAASNTSE